MPLNFEQMIVDLSSQSAENKAQHEAIHYKLDKLAKDVDDIKIAIVGQKDNEVKKWQKIFYIILPAFLGSGFISYVLKLLS
jgi:hypothetical protein